jgi:L-alanine-DL-glutamate epimerase-like enolase superfamily enzyme
MPKELPIDSVEWYVVKIERPYRYSELEDEVDFLPGTDYFIDYDWDQVYSLNLESLFVKVTTADGRYGWGEIQAPIVPEVAGALVENLVGPLVVGQDAYDLDRIRERLYRSMHVRGHYQGFMVDAVGGIDTALWDLVGKDQDVSAATMLGGRRRERLPAYVSMPGFTTDEHVSQARKYVDEGFSGVKAFLGHGVREDADQVRAIREEIGPAPDVFVDLFWSYGPAEAERLVARLAESDVGFVEAPLKPEDVAGHGRLAGSTSVPIAVGEPIRTRQEFEQWLAADAIDVAQPDLVRTGLTEGKKIADLVQTRGRPVAPHFGSALGVGMAATWQYASAISDLRVQEHQPVCFEEANRLLSPELRTEDGELVVPSGPGLGVDVDEDALAEFVVDSGTVS